MFGKWYQLYIKEYASGTPISPYEAERMDDHLQRYGALFCVPEKDGLPVSNLGEYEVRVLNPNALGFVRSILVGHYSVKIEREVENE